MTTLLWIIVFGLLMSCIALIGILTLFLSEETWEEWSLPLIAFAAGCLIGGATFHMIPEAVNKMGNVTELYCWFLGGFMVFYALEEFLCYHHSHTHIHHNGNPMNGPSPQQVPLEQSCPYECDPELKLGTNEDGIIAKVESTERVDNPAADEVPDIESNPTSAETSSSEERDTSSSDRATTSQKVCLILLDPFCRRRS